jgi:hypothetical protein
MKIEIMGRVFQKALLQNTVDVFKFQAGDIKETAIQSLEVEFGDVSSEPFRTFLIELRA